MLCDNCQSVVKGKFCQECGKQTVMTFDKYLSSKGKERVSHFKSKRRKLDMRTTDEATIFASLLKEVNGELKQVRSSRLPVIVNVTWGSVKLKEAVYEKFYRYEKLMSEYTISEVKLVYKSGEIIRFIPGTKIPFTIQKYKEDLGTGYHGVHVYLLPYDIIKSDEESDDVALPPAFMTSSDNAPRSFMSTVNDPSVSNETVTSVNVSTSFVSRSSSTSCSSSTVTTSSGRKVCHICSYSYQGDCCLICEQNQEYQESADVDIHSNRNMNTEIDIPRPKRTTTLPMRFRHSIGSPTNSVLIIDDDHTSEAPQDPTFRQKLANMHDSVLLVGNSFTLRIRRRNLYNDTVLKCKRFGDGVKAIKIEFIGEDATDLGGPLREFFSLYFESAEKELLSGRNPYTFKHDVPRNQNGEYCLFGKMVALSFLYGCPGPRNLIQAVATRLVGDPDPATPQMEDVPDYELQEKLRALASCTSGDIFDGMVANFDERFIMGYPNGIITIKDKDEMIKSVIHHSCISICLEEITAVQKGLEVLNVIDILKAHPSESLAEFVHSDVDTVAQDVINIYDSVIYSNDEDLKVLEEDIYFNFTNTLEAVESDELKNSSISVFCLETEQVTQKNVKMGDVLRFMTGSRFVCQKLNGKGVVRFEHFSELEKSGNRGKRVTINTCTPSVTFPVNELYCSLSAFTENFLSDVMSSTSFTRM